MTWNEHDTIVTGQEHGERWYAHPWCARWTVPLTDPVPTEAKCKGCGDTHPVTEAK